MNKIKVTESELRQIIAESVKNIIVETQQETYTLQEILDGAGFRGNVNSLIQALQNASQNPNTRITPNFSTTGKNWVWLFDRAALANRNNRALGMVLQNLVTQLKSTINAPKNPENVTPENARVVDTTYGLTGRYNPGAEQGMNPSNRPMTFNEVMNVIQGVASQGGDRAIKFTDITNGSTGALRGQNPNNVKNVIQQQLAYADRTLSQTNPQGLQNATNILTQWLNGQNQAIKIREVASALSTIGKVINNSRNNIPVVKGFQQTLNAFNIKDANGKPFAVDGIIGQNTSAALKQNGFKDIFDFKNIVMGAQKALGIKADGIVGKDTLAAFQQAGINSFESLRNYAKMKARGEQEQQAGILGRGNLKTPQVSISTPVQNNALASLEEGLKLRVTESELRQIIAENIKDVLNERNWANV